MSNAKSELSEAANYHDQRVSQKAGFLRSDPEFTRNDWAIYISNLPQRAGVPIQQIRKLVLKELADNALDEMDRIGQPGVVTIVQDAENAYTVTDQGRGFGDTPEELAHRFSIAKGMVSSKQWRTPTRGCVGNGLRVIVGAVVSGDGRIIIKTRRWERALFRGGGPLGPVCLRGKLFQLKHLGLSHRSNRGPDSRSRVAVHRGGLSRFRGGQPLGRP